MGIDDKVRAVWDRLVVEGLDPRDYHYLGIVRDLDRGVEWSDALVMNRWIEARA